MSEKLSESELIQLLAKAQEKVTIGAKYRHYKGNLYTVVDVAILTEEISVGVVYRAEYGANILFVRPLHVWLERVEHASKQMPRFAIVS